MRLRIAARADAERVWQAVQTEIRNLLAETRARSRRRRARAQEPPEQSRANTGQSSPFNESKPMPAIPHDKSRDSTLAMLRDPYCFIQKRCRTHGADLFQTPDAGEFGEDNFLAHELQYSNKTLEQLDPTSKSKFTIDHGPWSRV